MTRSMLGELADLQLTLQFADERLEAVEAYLVDRMEADAGPEGYRPDEAMRRAVDVREVRAGLQRCIAAAQRASVGRL